MKRLIFFAFVLSAVLALALLTGTAVRAADGDLEVLQLRPNFYMIAGAGGNIAVQVGVDGVVVVDSGSADKADAVIAAIKKITPAPIRYVINTSAEPDHVGGNDKLATAGQSLLLNRAIGIPGIRLATGPASVLAFEKVLERMSAPVGQTSKYPFAGWPTDTYNNDRTYMYLNGEGIEILHQPAAHSDSDSIVFFRGSDVIVAGDIYDNRHFPVIDVANGGSIQGEMASLNRIVHTAIPSVPIIWREAGTKVIPGHGYVGEQLDVANYRDMIGLIRDQVADCIKKGMTLEQTIAKKPAAGFTKRYGSDSGPWTTNKFIEATYKSLVEAKP